MQSYEQFFNRQNIFSLSLQKVIFLPWKAAEERLLIKSYGGGHDEQVATFLQSQLFLHVGGGHGIVAGDNMDLHGRNPFLHLFTCRLEFRKNAECAAREMLQKAVSASVVDSFNMISVDGDTSTNDTLLVLANGLAGN